MKIKKLLKMPKKQTVIMIGIIIILAVTVILLTVKTINTSTINVDYLTAKLEQSSELTSAKLTYTGLTEYTDKGIPHVNKGDFVMSYKATVRAGIDISKVKISADKNTKQVHITIPKAEVLDVKVDQSSIKYYNDATAILNLDAKVDVNKAILQTENDSKEEAMQTGILELADTQSATLIKGILSDAIPDDYEIIIDTK